MANESAQQPAPTSSVRFPGESAAYRSARDTLLAAEIDLRARIEEVAGRHVDSIWPLWNMLDFTLEGRGSDWYPQLEYRAR